MLALETTVNDHIAAIVLNGRLDAQGAGALDQSVKALPAEAVWGILDFSLVDFLSSAGIRSLLQAARLLKGRHGGLVLTGMKPMIEQTLKMAGLLSQLQTAATAEEAAAWIKRHAPAADSTAGREIDGRSYEVRRVPDATSWVETWDAGKGMMRVNLEELGLAIGTGGFGNTEDEAKTAGGLLISTGSFAAVTPADGNAPTDFILGVNPAETECFVGPAAGISGSPSTMIELASREPVALKILLGDVAELLGPDVSSACGVVMYLDFADLRLAHLAASETSCESAGATRAMVIGFASSESSTSDDAAARTFAGIVGQGDKLANGLEFLGHAVVLQSLPAPAEAPKALPDFLRLCGSADHVGDAGRVQLDSMVNSARLWVYQPLGIRLGVEKRLVIERPADTPFREEWEVIARRIYNDAGRIVLTPLHGGYSAATFHVSGYDRSGRRTIPTVLKVSSLANTRREETAYEKFVRPFILNNSTVIMGSAQCGDWAGLRYSFVGINGPDSKLTWLNKHYRERPVEEVLPILDNVVTRVLKPWYGQPRLEAMFPYVEHDPQGLFTMLLDQVKPVLGVSVDDPRIECPELGRDLPNPYHFLKNEFPKRRNQSRLWYRGPTHGDLNLQNILLDEKQNIYVIDFSETRIRNIVSDFARLEPIVKIEMTRFRDQDDLNAMMQFEEALVSVDRLGQPPPFKYEGDDPMVETAWRTICRLREYADRVTIFEDDMAPYLLAIMEWTYPVVVYAQLPVFAKRYSMLSCALMCEKLMRLEE